MVTRKDWNAPVLEPDLDDSHVEASVLTELFADVARRLGTGVVGRFQCFQLFGRDGRSRPLRWVIALCPPPKNHQQIDSNNKVTWQSNSTRM